MHDDFFKLMPIEPPPFEREPFRIFFPHDFGPVLGDRRNMIVLATTAYSEREEAELRAKVEREGLIGNARSALALAEDCRKLGRLLGWKRSERAQKKEVSKTTRVAMKIARRCLRKANLKRKGIK